MTNFSTRNGYNKFLKLLLALSYIVIFNLLFSANPIRADIYKWVDDQGVTHYSSTDNAKNSKPAQLPPIGRENISAKIAAIKESIPENCQSHGGVDCSAGADSDGSVICHDGHKGAILPFRFECLEAKIEVGPLLLSKDGLEPKLISNVENWESVFLEQKKARHLITLTLRNSSNINAENINVNYNPLKKGQKIEASGPSTLEPYGIGEYTVDLKLLIPFGIKALKNLAPVVNCRNCRIVVKAK